MNNIYRYLLSTYTYGFYRNISIKKDSDVLFTDRILLSTVNGLFYMNPAIQPIILYRLIGRIEISISNKDPLKNQHLYAEFSGNNFNTI